MILHSLQYSGAYGEDGHCTLDHFENYRELTQSGYILPPPHFERRERNKLSLLYPGPRCELRSQTPVIGLTLHARYPSHHLINSWIRP